ncbi:uncharacterized protein LOC109710911 [Ananas comosus]|uniref:Uncharacterized protein LOC109710911 n=1 Tax=Ananas comosus TaxID=4615 RepID=A0A6P5F7R4_ANACO|nr:uncharacterized protein LOC109710911 [Ananas comosus]
MFRNKILIRASPSSSSNLFLLPLSLSLSLSAPLPPPTLSLDLETLCWKLSRQWRLACLLQPSHILLLYQRAQSDAVARVVAELAKALPSIEVGEEEEVKSESLIAKAVECGLRSIMLDQKWTCVGNNTFVESTFSCSEERSNLCAINVQVQSEMDEFVFLLSPDVLRFTRHKISDLLSSKMMERFENKKEVILEESNFLTSCTTLPLLYEGHVIGFNKVAPSGESIDKLMALWSFKHGLRLASDHFIAVQLAYGCGKNMQWLPSSFVLRGSGFAPATQTIRSTKAMNALESFMKVLDAWDFFSQDFLIVKELLSVGNAISSGTKLPTWEKATCNLAYCTGKSNNSNDSRVFTHTSIASKVSCLALDFHTPRPALVNATCDKSVELTEIQGSVISLLKNDVEVVANVVNRISKPNSTCTCQPPAIKSTNLANGPDQYRVPSFTTKKRTDVHKDVDSPNKLTHADSESSTCKFALEEDTSIKRGVNVQSVSSENSQRKNDAFLSSNSSGNLAKVTQVGASGKRNSSCKKKIRPFPLFCFASHFCKTIKLL